MAVLESKVEPVTTTSFWATYRLGSWRGWVAIASVILFLLVPSLASFVSNGFLFLLPAAWALSIAAHFGRQPGLGRSQRLVRTGQTLAFNGLVLIVALFVSGFVSDFLLGPHGRSVAAVAAGFTTVHLTFGTGLVIRDVILE